MRNETFLKTAVLDAGVQTLVVLFMFVVAMADLAEYCYHGAHSA